ncbi:MAG TPA: phosphoribosylformylglycinamidine synthase [Flavobacteriales bacterium]|nr:phosphoribosylformylglycinamidine synthase [Flavobacteriales bacterium]
MKEPVLVFLFLCATLISSAQENEPDSIRIKNEILDSLFIQEVEAQKGSDKVLHAEPLFIDLIRDLGARKGEHELNIGMGLTDYNQFDVYTTLIEYEFAPIDRLGLEIELPFSFHYTTNGNQNAPGNKLNSLKLAAQYSFFVNEKRATSLALGYIHELELTEFSRYRSDRLFTGNVFNPFFVAAKRWGKNFHTLLYSGPLFFTPLHGGHSDQLLQINSNIHYMIPGTRNFVGIEFNKEVYQNDFDMVIRPQMRVSVSQNLLVGIVTGIPISRENQRFSSFLRLIYEPRKSLIGKSAQH